MESGPKWALSCIEHFFALSLKAVAFDRQFKWRWTNSRSQIPIQESDANLSKQMRVFLTLCDALAQTRVASSIKSNGMSLGEEAK